jgi:hypothetical protein
MSKWQQAPEVADIDEAQPKWAEAPPADLQWSDVPGQALRNAPGSALGVAKAVIEPLMHPIETGKNLAHLGKGVASKALNAAGVWNDDAETRTANESTADALGEFYKERYGSEAGFKKALAEDPVGVVADLTTFFTGGGAAAARVPGAVGRAGAVVRDTARAADPVRRGGQAAGYVAGRAINEGLGVSTGMGTRTYDEIARGGFQQGGSPAVRRHITDTPGARTEVVEQGREGVRELASQRGQQYQANLNNVFAQGGQIDYNPIRGALTQVQDSVMHKGLVKNPDGARILQDVSDAIDDYAVQAGNGLDDAHALKQRIGNIRDATEQGTPARHVADQAYNAVRAEIERQAPAYADMNAAYAAQSHEINELNRGLSLGEKATDDTALRKLQSTMRNNAYTSWGHRSDMLDELATRGGQPDLPQALAGQSAAQWSPRGLVRQTAAGIGLGGGGAAAALGGTLGPLAIPAALAVMSPRVMGETVYATNRVRGILERAGVPPQQIGYVLGELSQGEGEKPDDKKRLLEILMRRAAADRGQ